MECADCGRRGPLVELVRQGQSSDREEVAVEFGAEVEAWLVRSDVQRPHTNYTEYRLESVCPRCQRERRRETP